MYPKLDSQGNSSPQGAVMHVVVKYKWLHNFLVYIINFTKLLLYHIYVLYMYFLNPALISIFLSLDILYW